MTGYVDTMTAALLTGDADNRVREKIAKGIYQTAKRQGQRGGGISGESYLIAVASLPLEAQIRYLVMDGGLSACPEGCDLAGYRERYGEDGLRELLRKQRAAMAGLTVRGSGREDMLDELGALAEEYGVSLRTLYRWMDGYEAHNISGLMRSVHRADHGTAKSMCAASRQFVYRQYADNVRRTQNTVFEQLKTEAAMRGTDACACCIFNEDSEARLAALKPEELEQYPPCDEPAKTGMKVPAHRSAVNRLIGRMSPEELTLARRGKKAWQDDYMLMAKRSKPEMVNAVWFGDHHQLDVFAVDDRGHAVRPWMTAWMDAATGSFIGWALTTQPNTDTITQSFARAIVYTKGSPFHGAPACAYIDNGKDYRSHTFEGHGVTDLGLLNAQIADSSVIHLLGVQVIHARAYQGWSKSIERAFGTLEDKYLREVPGWCGNSPDERPEGFDHNKLLESGTLWTMDELYTYLHGTVFPAYHNTVHEGYGDKTPLELYATLPRARQEEFGWNMLSIAREERAQRVVSQQGIRLDGEVYWDETLMHHVGDTVTIRYDKLDRQTVSVLLGDQYLCDAEPKERLQLVGEDESVLAAHIGRQKRQLREIRENIYHASRNAFYEAVDESKARGNVTALEYEKAVRGRARKRTEMRERKAADTGAADQVTQLLQQKGREVLRREIIQ